MPELVQIVPKRTVPSALVMVKDAWPVTKDTPSIITNAELVEPQDALTV
jgi:hypothetical protein